MAYAERTDVPVAQTIAEIRKLVERTGHSQFQYGEMEDRLVVGFSGERMVRIIVPFGPRPDAARDRSKWEQAKRSKARALLLTIKARIESVTAGIETFEEAFLAHVLMPKGLRVGDMTRAPIEAAYRSGEQPPTLLPDYSSSQ